MVGSMSLPSRQNHSRKWLPIAVLAGCTAASAIVWAPLLPRAPDLYVHLIWSWEVMRCFAHGQLPLWLPDLNAGFGSPGIRLYSPLGPILTGGLGLLLGEAGRGMRAAALVAAAGALAVPRVGRKAASDAMSPWTGLLVLVSPMVLFSLFGRAAWSEFLAVPLLWWILERLLDGRIRADRDGAAVAALWLFHAPSALMAGVMGGVSLVLHRSRDHTLRLTQLAAVGGGLTAWHWLPLLQESAGLGGQEVLTSGIFDPARNYLGSASAHALHHNIWLGWVGVALLLSVLVARSWRSHPRRTALAVACIVMASPLASPLWKLHSPLQLLQFPWRFLLPATLVLIPALVGPRVRSGIGIACLVAPSFLMVWTQLVRVPDLDAGIPWEETGGKLYQTIGANPLVVDAAQNRPPAFGDLPRNLRLFGTSDAVVISGIGSVESILRWSPLRRRIEVIGNTPITLGFRILDYPFWSVSTEDGNVGGAGGAPGIVTCRLPAGRHFVDVKWKGNPLASYGQVIAGLTVAALVLGRRRWSGVTS